MASYNGLLASKILDGSTASQMQGSTAVSYVNVTTSLPAKYFSSGQFAIQVLGVSGLFGIQIVGAVGGATFVIAGKTGISAAGNFAVPLFAFVGSSGTVPVPSPGIPRPCYVAYQSGITGPIGFTAHTFMCGEYN